MSNFKAGAFFDEGNIVEVGLRNPDAPADGDGGLYARDVIRGVELPGGGGGDFSTAVVELVNLGEASLYGPFISINAEAGLPSPYTGIAPSNPNAGDNTVALYKGKCIALPMPGVAITSASGSVEVLGDYNAFLISGNCTIAGQPL